MENNHNPMEDDGSLDFLKIPADETNKHFNCPETTQQKLINLTFWVCDYIEGVKTKFGSDRTLVKIKMNRDDPDRDARKFFTNSREIKYVLAKIREMDKFPRRVTMRASGTRYYFRLPRTGRTSTGAASISSGSCSTTTKRSCANPSSRISAAWPRV